jgi:hypothetical protein
MCTRRVGFALAATLLAGCAEENACVRTDPVPQPTLSTVEAAPNCQPIGAVEVRSGEHDPTSHELLRSYAVDHGATYVVLDAFGVIATRDDVFAVTRARLFRCPTELVWYHRPR